MRQSGVCHGRIAVLAIIASVVLSGCGGGAAPPPSKPVIAPTTAPAPTAAPAAAAPASAKPADGAAPAAAKPAEAAASAAAANVPVLNVGLVNNLQYAPWFVGVEKGIFLKNGVDVKVRLFNSGAEVLKAIQAGELQTGIASFGTLIVAHNQDINIRGFLLVLNDALVLQPDEQYAIIAHPNSNARTLADLRGKKMGTPLGTTTDLYLKASLEQAGVPTDTVEYVNVTNANTPSAYATGVDGVVSIEPYGELILAKYPEARLLKRGGGLMAQRVALTATDEWLNANRPLVEKVVAGFVEAAFVTRTQPDVAAEVVPRWLTGVDGPVAAKAIKHLAFDPRVSPFVSESWDTDAQLLLEQKKIKSAIPFKRGMDLAINQEIPRNYPQYLTDLKPLP